MADPDAVKKGYTRQYIDKNNQRGYYNPEKKGQQAWAGNTPKQPVYNPITKKPATYSRYDSESQRGQAVDQRQVAKEQKKAAQRQANINPLGDYDKDGIPNIVDKHDMHKTELSPQTKKITKEVKTVYEIPSHVFPSYGMGSQGSVELTDAQKYKLAQQHIKDIEKQDGRSYAILKSPDGSFYINRVTEQKVDNQKYQKKLNLDGDKRSGTNEDYRRLAQIKVDKLAFKEEPVVGDRHSVDYSQGSRSVSVGHNRTNKPEKEMKITKGGGEGFAKKQDVKSLMLKNGGNGDNLTRLFQKAYGADGSSTLSATIEKMKLAAGSEVKEVGKPGQYGYTIAVKTQNGWTTDPNEIKDSLVKYVPSVTGSESSSLADKIKLAGSSTGGLETGLSKRFGRAFYNGDTQKGNQSLMTAFNEFKAKNPGKIRFIGTPGEPGSYIQVKVNGEWVSKSDEVAKQLSAFVRKDGSKQSVALDKQQKDLLMGANGNAVLNNFVYKYGGDVGLAQKNLKIAMSAYEKSNPGNDIRYFGNIGQPGFYIEVKTKNGWVNGTQTVLNKLEKFMPKPTSISNPTPPVDPAGSAFAPGASGPNQSGGPAQPPSTSVDSSDPNNQADPSSQAPLGSDNTVGQDQELNASLPGPVSAGQIDQQEQGLNIGLVGGSQQLDQYDKNQTEWALNRKAEIDSYKASSSNGAPKDVNIGEAARKSQELMMAFDLDGNGQLSDSERALMANGDQNNNGIVGEYGLKKFVEQADTNNSGLVSQAEVKAYNVVDTNNNNKLGAREIKAYGNVDANNDGDITKKEAKAMVKDLRAQVDLSKQEKKDLDLAKQYLAKSNGKSGGADSVDAQVAALVNSQPKHDKKGDTGPKGVTKKNK